jgi:uncharacterized membrane protein
MAFEPALEQSVAARLKRYFVRGAVLVVPALVTVGVLVLAFRFLSGFLRPLAVVIGGAVGVGGSLAELLVLFLLTLVVLLVGFAAETVPHSGTAADLFHSVAESIPGVGRVYGGFRQMSETVANGGESFRDVKLVEYPSAGSYTMAFVTADAPDHLEESAGHAGEGMVSLFLPMGPNPVMGGFVIYVSRDRVHDIDVGVEEGLQAIITSGVTMNEAGDGSVDRPHGPPRGE